jgi:hypothetical protein
MGLILSYSFYELSVYTGAYHSKKKHNMSNPLPSRETRQFVRFVGSDKSNL